MSEITNQVGTSITALMREFNIITHNMANISTVGYKRVCNSFSKAMDGTTPSDSTGTVDLTSAFDFSQGNITDTGRPLDFALMGDGFFIIETTKGPVYTRNGMFMTNADGRIVDTNGRSVSGEDGVITLPPTTSLSEVHVSSDGRISAGGALIGKFRIVDFNDKEAELLPAGGSCFEAPKDIRPGLAENIVVKQGYLEASNVKMVDELVDMIMVQRLYEANMKFITAQKETSGSLMSLAMG
jgi:flagellar basal-body rod protein FlgF